MTILDEIFKTKRAEIARRRNEFPLEVLQASAQSTPPPLDFCAALRGHVHPALIAEVKRRSPSRGVLCEQFDPFSLARTYQQNGAAAISILTDERYFGGSLEILQQAAAEPGRLPLLCKDFICDPYQVYEARVNGADAVLLIVAGLKDNQLLMKLHSLICNLGMAPLVEVHSAPELQTALTCQPHLIGINNRDLHDFSVRLETTMELRSTIPPGVLVVSESGIHNLDDIRRLESVGVDAILVGEAIVTSDDPSAQVRRLAQVEIQP